MAQVHRVTGTITRTNPMGPGRIDVPTVHTSLQALRREAQGFAIGTPGDLIQYTLGTLKGGYQFVRDDSDGHLVEYDGQGVKLRDPAPVIPVTDAIESRPEPFLD